LVTDFLAWQVGIVNEYKQDGQFVTQNFDFEWRGYSYGIQGDVDHFAASRPFDITSVDIYHPSQDELTGIEISFGGDVARSTKQSNYLVLETEAQAFWHWVPYPGQLRLQAFSHLASGANMVAYWHWHSLHNSFETYWKGLLSHDFEPNPVYNEAKTIGSDFARLSPKLVNLKKTNRVAVLFSNEALTSIKWFGFNFTSDKNYNDVVRWMYDELYKMNMGCDLIDPSVESYAGYDVLVVPALYAASDALLEKLNQFVQDGGHIVYSFKSGFANEHIKVRSTRQPGLISEACGISYNLFVEPKHVALRDDPFGVGEEHNQVHTWMELITPTTAEVLAWYDHPHWGEYAAITQNNYGKGRATYVGCYTSAAVIRKVLERVMKDAGVWGADQELAFPLIVKTGINEQGQTIRYYFNYSDEPVSFHNPHGDGTELLSGDSIAAGQELVLGRWGIGIIEQN
jgi:beta-galactosidase